MSNNIKDPIIVAISGATGSIYGVTALRILKQMEIKTILVVSDMGLLNVKHELDMSLKDLTILATEHYRDKELGASISSGSFLTAGMIVAPCSVKSLSNIANCNNDNLLARAADVTLKERRKLVLLLRETPLHMGHIKLMEQVTLSGGVIMPPVPAFYGNPKTIDDIVNHTIARCLDLFGINTPSFSRWEGL